MTGNTAALAVQEVRYPPLPRPQTLWILRYLSVKNTFQADVRKGTHSYGKIRVYRLPPPPLHVHMLGLHAFASCLHTHPCSVAKRGEFSEMHNRNQNYASPLKSSEVSIPVGSCRLNITELSSEGFLLASTNRHHVHDHTVFLDWQVQWHSVKVCMTTWILTQLFVALVRSMKLETGMSVLKRTNTDVITPDAPITNSSFQSCRAQLTGQRDLAVATLSDETCSGAALAALSVRLLPTPFLSMLRRPPRFCASAAAFAS